MSGALMAKLPIGDGHVLVENGVVSALEAFRQREPSDREAGGILLGYRRGPHVHVTGFTPPFPADRRTRRSFDRKVEGHAEVAHRQWRASDEQIDYLGEWHSHPESDARPSSVDLREWSKLLRDRNSPLVFLILGSRNDWLGVGTSGSIDRLVPYAAGKERIDLEIPNDAT